MAGTPIDGLANRQPTRLATGRPVTGTGRSRSSSCADRLNHTERGDWVYDPFLGSEPLIAAEQTSVLRGWRSILDTSTSCLPVAGVQRKTKLETDQTLLRCVMRQGDPSTLIRARALGEWQKMAKLLFLGSSVGRKACFPGRKSVHVERF
jgi:hypothetical protein